MGITVLCAVAWCLPSGGSDRLVFTFLSVGAGSVTVIELPDGRAVLYDAGSSRPYDVGRGIVVPFLRHRGITRLDRIYLSHANLDHFSAVPTILDRVETGPLVLNAYFEPHSRPRSPSRHLLDSLAASGHALELLPTAPATWQLGGATFELLAPLGPTDVNLSTNDTSTVLRVSYAGHSLLLTGDIESPMLSTLLRRGDLHADVLMLPHHGSVRPPLKAFVEAVRPSVLIRSSHQRMDQTLSGLSEIAGTIPLYNTADSGAIVVVLGTEGVQVSTFRPPN